MWLSSHRNWNLRTYYITLWEIELCGFKTDNYVNMCCTLVGLDSKFFCIYLRSIETSGISWPLDKTASQFYVLKAFEQFLCSIGLQLSCIIGALNSWKTSAPEMCLLYGIVLRVFSLKLMKWCSTILCQNLVLYTISGCLYYFTILFL